MKKKGLQKFTNFEEIKTKENFKELYELDKNKFEDLRNWLLDKINEAKDRETPIAGEMDRYFNRFENLLQVFDTEQNPECERTFKRDRWYINDGLIKGYIHNHLIIFSELPSNTRISQDTGLSRVTIDKHLKDNYLQDFKQEEKDKYKMLSDKALNRLYQIGMKTENVKALKMFIDYTRVPMGANNIVNNNYLQINNTRIDAIVLEQIPLKDRLRIESIILKNTTNT